MAIKIKFNRSMGANIRNENEAYLRYNILDRKTTGLYQAKGFSTISGVPSSIRNSDNILASTESRLYVKNGTGTDIYTFKKDGLELCNTIPELVISADGSKSYDKVIAGTGNSQKIYTVKDCIVSHQDISYITGYDTGYVLPKMLFDFTRFMHLGSTSEATEGEVYSLQVVLGVVPNDIVATFDSMVEQKVKDFQTSRGIVSDGIVGPITRGEFNKRKNVPIKKTVNDDNAFVKFDGWAFFYFIDGHIYRQKLARADIDPNTPIIQKVFNDLGDIKIHSVIEQNHKFFIHFNVGSTFSTVVWDKKDKDYFVDNIKFDRSIFLGAGNIETTNILVVYEWNSQNNTEYRGKIVIKSYTGSGYKNFKTLFTGELKDNPNKVFKESSNTILFYVDIKTSENDEKCRDKDIWEKYVYRIGVDNGLYVEAIYKVKDTLDDISISEWDEWIFENKNNKIYSKHNSDYNSCNDRYDGFEDSVYITNFYGQSAYNKRVEEMPILFEKMTKSNESVKIEYRVSKRDSFELIEETTYDTLKENTDTNMSNVVVNDVLRKQSIPVYKEDDTTDEYNEIQFKFTLKNGASIIRASADNNKAERHTEEN